MCSQADAKMSFYSWFATRNAYVARITINSYYRSLDAASGRLAQYPAADFIVGVCQLILTLGGKMQVMQFQRADRRSKGRSIKCRHHARGTDFSQGVMYILARAACDNTHVCVVLIFKKPRWFETGVRKLFDINMDACGKS